MHHIRDEHATLGVPHHQKSTDLMRIWIVRILEGKYMWTPASTLGCLPMMNPLEWNVPDPFWNRVSRIKCPHHRPPLHGELFPHTTTPLIVQSDICRPKHVSFARSHTLASFDDATVSLSSSSSQINRMTRSQERLLDVRKIPDPVPITRQPEPMGTKSISTIAKFTYLILFQKN